MELADTDINELDLPTVLLRMTGALVEVNREAHAQLAQGCRDDDYTVLSRVLGLTNAVLDKTKRGWKRVKPMRKAKTTSVHRCFCCGNRRKCRRDTFFSQPVWRCHQLSCLVF